MNKYEYIIQWQIFVWLSALGLHKSKCPVKCRSPAVTLLPVQHRGSCFAVHKVCAWPWVRLFWITRWFCCITKAYFCMYSRQNLIYFCLKSILRSTSGCFCSLFTLQKLVSRLCDLCKKPAWKRSIQEVCRADTRSVEHTSRLRWWKEHSLEDALTIQNNTHGDGIREIH